MKKVYDLTLPEFIDSLDIQACCYDISYIYHAQEKEGVSGSITLVQGLDDNVLRNSKKLQKHLKELQEDLIEEYINNGLAETLEDYEYILENYQKSNSKQIDPRFNLTRENTYKLAKIYRDGQLNITDAINNKELFAEFIENQSI